MHSTNHINQYCTNILLLNEWCIYYNNNNDNNKLVKNIASPYYIFNTLMLLRFIIYFVPAIVQIHYYTKNRANNLLLSYLSTIIFRFKSTRIHTTHMHTNRTLELEMNPSTSLELLNITYTHPHRTVGVWVQRTKKTVTGRTVYYCSVPGEDTMVLQKTVM